MVDEVIWGLKELTKEQACVVLHHMPIRRCDARTKAAIEQSPARTPILAEPGSYDKPIQIQSEF